jgi:hypothetical protein
MIYGKQKLLAPETENDTRNERSHRKINTNMNATVAIERTFCTNV